MTPYLIALAAVALAIALWLQNRRANAHIGRLTEALRSGDRQSLGDGPFHRAPLAIRELEQQIFEQLFETENLEKRITRREALLEAVVGGLGDAVVVFDRELNIRFTNPSACHLFGWDETPLGRRATDCIGSVQLLDALERSVTHGESETGEIRHNVPGEEGRTPRTLEVDIAPLLRTDVNSVSRVRAVLHDVTGARQLEQVRKDFVANASHELRTPLTIINGYLENLIGSNLDDRELSMRFLSVMQKHGDRIARIIEDMLTISKLESHAETLQREAFDLQTCAEEVVARLSPLIEQKHAKISLEFPEDATIAGDAFYWDQVFFNLIENALKENDSSGLRIGVSMKREPGQDVVSVSDNGVGIPKSAHAFIFNRFYRVDQNRNAEKKGTGLGLSIVKHAVEAHGASIELQSTPGVETVFDITLPRPAAGTSTREREGDEPNGENAED